MSKISAAAKTINKFIRIMFLARDNIVEGILYTKYATLPVHPIVMNVRKV